MIKLANAATEKVVVRWETCRYTEAERNNALVPKVKRKTQQSNKWATGGSKERKIEIVLDE